jgi:DMSO/TMAO reductase YedYZ molybdopterin-dependent catalytic subunit
MSLVALEGDISIPRTFSFSELRAIPQQHLVRSPRTHGRTICGVRLTALTDALGLKSWARFAVVRSSDGYAANIPVEALDECTLGYAIEGSPLPISLGGPVRLLTRTLGACANVKNVALISFAIEPAKIEHACAHELARARGLAVLAGGRL